MLDYRCWLVWKGGGAGTAAPVHDLWCLKTGLSCCNTRPRFICVIGISGECGGNPSTFVSMSIKSEGSPFSGVLLQHQVLGMPAAIKP